ncbi:AraC family transcriptional regulator [Riemerella anatipestifer]|nr:helix-turn-helix domain-containing protein [Riemerella anatipestifer]AZZ58843.1 AraC family transcriptional regulator [Riemerella anatipestifer]MBT0573342.1 AraC family transcriptional regulator [Riemerella anatipestifer]MCO7319314.1 AraC family transcriptional regulator [Riemerella anatipestifer]MCQ4155595.1 AraC family transcriptional regulator [Riemerella anatipestifer]MCQ4181553.1 AraC family transcriptional regulator [Riemerella anatipestifer]
MIFGSRIMLYRLFVLFFLIEVSSLSAQSYSEISSKYSHLDENDLSAIPYIKQYIAKAKKEKNYTELAEGCLDFSYYHPNDKVKSKYADSAVIAAELSPDIEKTVTSYVARGSLYYFYYRDFKKALRDYITAFNYSKKNKENPYRDYTIIYHIGVIKSHLGYYEEALEQFRECISFFEPFTRKKLSQNTLFNHQKGYYNSMHQAIVCYQKLGNYQKADSLIKVGLSETKGMGSFSLEHAYFTKSNALSNFYQKKYHYTISSLELALPSIIKNKDIAGESIGYLYLGKSYLNIKQRNKGILYLKKIDSIFNTSRLVIPELRENYELLIKDARLQNDTQQELYYINQLLSIDKVLSKDFSTLSSKIHKEYDTQKLLDAKAALEKKSYWWLTISSSVILALCIVLYFRRKKEKEIHKKYLELERKIKDKKRINLTKSTPSEKPNIDQKIFDKIVSQLENFEHYQGFTEKGITLSKLSKKFNTNSKYLSQVISETRHTNFNRYISELRINYITHLLFNDKRYLNYTIESLAEKCGIQSRQNFSDLFLEINGIRPTDFIKKRKKSVE